MNFYPFHIGDYASATRHLSWAEDLAYRRLLDVYYVRESPLPAELRQVYRLVIASTDEQRAAVDAVLAEFFEVSPEGYQHKRCDNELANAQKKSATAAASARARWGDAKNQDVASLKPSERNASAQETPSERTEKACVRDAPKTNPKTITNIEAKASKAYEPPEWVPLEAWGEFVAMRKAMRNVPFTAAAARGVVAELDKLRGQGHGPGEMLQRAVTNGWRTVYAPKEQRGPPPQSQRQSRGAEAIRITGARSPVVIEGDALVIEH